MTFIPPGSYITDNDSFAPPTFGGAVAVKFAPVANTDTTAKELFVLPTGAVIVGITTDVQTAFDDSGTNLLDVGTSDNDDAYAVDLDVSSVAQINTGYVAGAFFATSLENDVTVTATYTGQNGNSTEGTAIVCIFYVMI